jgi:hypothetical protein
LSRGTLLSSRQASARPHEWTAGTGPDALTLKPFMDIQDEPYTTYLKLSRG